MSPPDGFLGGYCYCSCSCSCCAAVAVAVSLRFFLELEEAPPRIVPMALSQSAAALAHHHIN
jgi:hypothetical protein